MVAKIVTYHAGSTTTTGVEVGVVGVGGGWDIG